MRKHFALLDLLRGVAAFAVLVFHQPEGKIKLFAHGYLAVDFFFLLSGFVIAASYQERLSSGVLGLRSFVLTRIIRLYPLIILGGVLGATQHAGLYPAIVVAGGILLFPTRASGEVSAFATNPPAWSLFWEIAVNVFYAVVVKHLNTARTALITAAGAISLLACAYTFKTMDFGFSHENFYGGGPRVIFSFFAGLLTYRIWLRGLRPSLPWYLVIIVLVALLMIPRRFGIWYIDSLLVLMFPILVLVAASCEFPKKLENVATFLGNVSYPLYILQSGLGLPGWVYSEYHIEGAAGFLLKWTWTGMVCVLATCAFYFFDKPVRNWLNRHFKAKPRVVAASAP